VFIAPAPSLQDHDRRPALRSRSRRVNGGSTAGLPVTGSRPRAFSGGIVGEREMRPVGTPEAGTGPLGELAGVQQPVGLDDLAHGVGPLRLDGLSRRLMTGGEHKMSRAPRPAARVARLWAVRRRPVRLTCQAALSHASSRAVSPAAAGRARPRSAGRGGRTGSANSRPRGPAPGRGGTAHTLRVELMLVGDLGREVQCPPAGAAPRRARAAGRTARAPARASALRWRPPP
jgi:hypothetical protein